MNYSSFAPACQAEAQITCAGDIDFDNLSDDDLKALNALEAEEQVDNKVKRTRVKSVYRDALFRPLFQGIAALDDLRANGGTSVTYATPSHPLFPVLHITNDRKPPSTLYKHEHLTDAEERLQARFWRDYAVQLQGLREHVVPAPWRDLSDPGRLEWFHHALRSQGDVKAFTLRLSDDVEARARKHASTAGWLSKRIARELEEALGRKVDYWFALEVSVHHKLHLHGELQIASGEAEAARKAFRVAAGEWASVRQHQAHTEDEPSVVWANYSAKDWNHIRPRPKHGRLAGVSRPINGEWYFATKPIRRLAAELYSEQLREVIKLMKTLSLPKTV
ncbi:hypothetical protein [Mesorhizobium sp. B1-1-7]|uniref:hypothetical protein n=1 Tax=Mesorhizobium sp. B1-1-7 TaxID=2589977 RepID=UPI00112738C7|nr:hypothetical protein [Mesorhizobium sp. B1-1-7]TPN53900.1 hypothetical protein FJ978_07275 [Mesorhizobium sp. B1-1-7]